MAFLGGPPFMERYPIIAHLDSDAAQAVREIQLELEKECGTHALLREWHPHIAVGSEALIKEKDVDAYTARIRKAVKGLRPLEITINGINCIDFWSGGGLPDHTPYVVFSGVYLSPKLHQLLDAVESVTAKEKLFYKMHTPYFPHIALAYKDLSAEGYERAKELLMHRRFTSEARIDHFALAKQDETGMFREFRRIELAG
jgi:2'-5' RNA ligase